MRNYSKAVVMMAVAGLTALSSALTDGVTPGEGIQITIVVVTAAGVWLVPAVPSWPQMKTWVAALLATLNLAVSTIDGGLTGSEIINLVLAGAAVLTVRMVPGGPVHPEPAQAGPRPVGPPIP